MPPGTNVQPGMVVVTAGEVVGSATSFVSYDAPISSFSPANIPSFGKTSVSIFGSSFGIADYSSASRLGGTPAEAVFWVSDSAVVCRASAGLRPTRSGSVTVGRAVDSMTEAMSYDAPIISSAMVTMLSAVITRVDFVGVSMGTRNYSPKSRVQGSACDETVWVSDTALICRAGARLQPVSRAVVTVEVFAPNL
jgi:hypothetical protein